MIVLLETSYVQSTQNTLFPISPSLGKTPRDVNTKTMNQLIKDNRQHLRLHQATEESHKRNRQLRTLKEEALGLHDLWRDRL